MKDNDALNNKDGLRRCELKSTDEEQVWNDIFQAKRLYVNETKNDLRALLKKHVADFVQSINKILDEMELSDYENTEVAAATRIDYDISIESKNSARKIVHKNAL